LSRLVIPDAEDICEELQILDTASVDTDGVERERVDPRALATDGVPGRLQGIDAIE
jgi:hypothetical protein